MLTLGGSFKDLLLEEMAWFLTVNELNIFPEDHLYDETSVIHLPGLLEYA